MAGQKSAEPVKIAQDTYACASCNQAFESRTPSVQCPVCAATSTSKAVTRRMSKATDELMKQVARLGTVSKEVTETKVIGNALRGALQAYAKTQGVVNATPQDGVERLWMNRLEQVTNPLSRMRESTKTEVVSTITTLLQREEQQNAPVVDLTGLDETELLQLLMPLAEQMLYSNEKLLAQCATAQGFTLVPNGTVVKEGADAGKETDAGSAGK
jgi:DNA-directed RNA polymerase subunit RPC12/RpoP